MSLFFVADNKILDDPKLSSNDKVIYFKLVSYMNRKTGSCFPRHATISKAIGLSRSTIYRSCLHLAKLGYIRIVRKSSTNEYHLPRQVELESYRKKYIVDNYVSKDSNNVSGVTDINKRHINYNTYKNKFRRFNNRPFNSQGGLVLHKPLTFEYKGELYKERGTIDMWYEMESKSGKRIRKHKYKNTIEEDPPRKKIRTAANEMMQHEVKAS